MKRKQLNKAGKTLALALGGLLLASAAAQAAPAAATGTINQPNIAQRELENNARRAGSRDGLSIPLKNVYIPCASVRVEGNKHVSEKRIRKLLPELEKQEMNVRLLSQQIQLANSSGALQLALKLVPQTDGRFTAVVQVVEKQRDHLIETLTNGGNDYTGNWRLITSYVNSNLTERADTLGVSYVGAPGHGNDVQQAAFSYRALLPRAAGELNVFGGWSDVDMGSIYRAQVSQPLYSYNLDLQVDGSSHNLGLRYTQHLSYSSKEKDAWDVGFERKYYKNNAHYAYNISGSDYSFTNSSDYAINEFTLRFRHQELARQHFFGWSLGLMTNIDGKAEDYRGAMSGADAHYTIWRGAAQYQYRTKRDWLLSARGIVQYTEDNVISPQQLGVGGMNNTLRGYNERTLNSDRGFLGNVEIFTPELLPHTRVLFFTDVASLHNNNASMTWQHEGVATAGLGLRYNDSTNGLYVSLDYVAKIMNDISRTGTAQPDHKRWNLVLTKVF